MSKFIVIAGTDCSGKETQTKMLVENLKKLGIKVCYIDFPNYNSSTGKIVGGPCIGKEHIGVSFFEEGFSNVDPKVACLYYAADRRYNLPKMEELFKEYDVVISDRYVESNMAHQGGKIKTKEDRISIYKWIEELEYNLLSLKRPDATIFLYMPYECTMKLSQNRDEKLDSVESDSNYLKNSEMAYLELSDLYNFKKVNCSISDEIRSKEDISKEVLEKVLEIIKEED